MAAKEQTIQFLLGRLSASEIETKILGRQVAAKESELERMANTLGWRLLSLYGKIKYPYLMFLYRLVHPGPRNSKAQNQKHQ